MLEVVNIKKTFKKNILKDVSFSADKGQCIGILGANGCGKTTLLEIIAGAKKPDSGKILFQNRDALKNKNIFSKYIGYVPQENALIKELSVKDNLSIWYCKSNKKLNDDFKNGFPAMLGLNEIKNMPVYKLSGGMKKRVSIACALANDPPILILDEPSAALDLIYKREIRNYLKFYLSQEKTIIITTHEEEELELCSKLFVLKSGIIREIPANARGEVLINNL